MKYFVIWDFGWCVDSNHSNGMFAFDTEEQAKKKLEETVNENTNKCGYISIIKGEEIFSKVTG